MAETMRGGPVLISGGGTKAYFIAGSVGLC